MSEDGSLRLKLGIAMIVGGSFVAGCCGGLGAENDCATCGDDDTCLEDRDGSSDALVETGRGGDPGR
jgi:hypothetical protein